jgi:hypothetical protein
MALALELALVLGGSPSLHPASAAASNVERARRSRPRIVTAARRR